MNGTAFFEAITVVFLAQAFGVPLGLATQALIVVLTVLTAVSAVGIPSGSIPLIVVMLVTVGVPGEAIALIFGVEPILGMARTSTNVTGDLAASLVVTRAEGLSRGNVTKKRGAGDPAPEHARILISQRAATGTGNGPSTPWAPCRLSDQAW
jgi:DAACS family dicarboxylate/amino acid:cation (Na+ or H+) symporter